MIAKETESMTAIKSLKKVAYAQGLIDESINRENHEMFPEIHGHLEETLMKHYQKGREDYRAMQNGDTEWQF